MNIHPCLQLFCFLLLAGMLAAAPVRAQGFSGAGDDLSIDSEDSIPAAQSHTVTSPQTCFDQLDPAEALEIQKRSLKPYQECLMKLSEKLQRQKTIDLEAAEAEDDVPEAETPRNYVRVQAPESIDKKKRKRADDGAAVAEETE